MDWKEIDALYAKYLEGETSLRNEARLRQFFSEYRGEIPPKYQAAAQWFTYAAWFAGRQSAGTETDAATITGQNRGTGRVRNMFQSRNWSIAAGFALILGMAYIWFTVQQQQQQQLAEEPVYANMIVIDNEEEAIETLLEALALVSSNLDKGRRAMVTGLVQLDEANPFTHSKKQHEQ